MFLYSKEKLILDELVMEGITFIDNLNLEKLQIAFV